MPERGVMGRPRTAREESARRGEHIAQVEHAHRRLQCLYDISKVLLRFESVERTVPEVVSTLAETLPLGSAVFILRTAGPAQTITWLPEGQDAQRLQEVWTHAERAYRYLVSSGIDLGHEPARTLRLPRQARDAREAEPPSRPNFVMLPLVVGRGPVFGAFEIEGATRLSEPDLIFLNAVVNQLAIALDRHFADGALRQSEAKLAGIISVAADAIIVIDKDQCITLFNEGAESIFGYSEEEVLTAPLDILIPERFRAAHRQHVERFAAGEEVTRRLGERGEAIVGLRKNGEEFPADATVSRFEVGGTRILTVALRDITEQKRIAREQSFLAQVGPALATTLEFEETLSKIAELAVRELADFCLVDVVEEDEGVRRLKALGRDPTREWVSAALARFHLDRSRAHVVRSVIETRKPLLMEVTEDTLTSWAQNGEHLRALRGMAAKSVLAVPLLAYDRLLGVLWLASSTRTYGPADLHLAEELALRAALSIENARLYRAANRAIRARDDVLGVVAHDLRNPLGTILMEASLLRRRGAGPERRSQEPWNAIERAATRMERLIQDLLDVARMEAGSLSVEQRRLPTVQVISDVLEFQKPLASSASLELELDLAQDLPDVWADRDRLLQVFENLVGNARKFTAPGGRITIGAAPRDADVLFWVSDTGPGIATEDVPHLFDSFWQASGGGARGVGLGLSIVKGLVEAHGGRVWVSTMVGKGSTFFFTIPVAPPTPTRWSPAASSSRRTPPGSPPSPR